MFMADNVARLQSKLEVVDATLVSTAGEALAPLRRTGMTLGFLPNPVDFSIETGRCDETPDLPYDLFYAAGSPDRPPRVICGRSWNLNAFITELLGRLPQIRALNARPERRAQPRRRGLSGRPGTGGDRPEHQPTG